MQLASISNDNPGGSPGDGCLSSKLLIEQALPFVKSYLRYGGLKSHFLQTVIGFTMSTMPKLNGLKLLGARTNNPISIY